MMVLPDDVGAHTTTLCSFSTSASTSFCHWSSLKPEEKRESGGSRSCISVSWKRTISASLRWRFAFLSSALNECTISAASDFFAPPPAALGLSSLPFLSFLSSLPFLSFLSSLPPFLSSFASSASASSASTRLYTLCASIAHSTSNSIGWSFPSSPSFRMSSICRSLPSGVAGLTVSTARVSPFFAPFAALSSFSQSRRMLSSTCFFSFAARISSAFDGFFALPPFAGFFASPPAASANAASSAASAASASFSRSHVTRGSNVVSGARLRRMIGMRVCVPQYFSRRFLMMRTRRCGGLSQYTSYVRSSLIADWI